MTTDAQTDGIHHVTAIASDPQRNVEFYTDVLGLRLVKQTVNFDDPTTYHLYYADEGGTPGTVLTFFPFEGGRPGRVGRGQVTATAFVVPAGSLGYWTQRFDELEVDRDDPTERFGERVLPFRDYDGQPFELVTAGSDVEPWESGPIPTEHAIRGFHGVTLDSLNPEVTAEVLGDLGYEVVGEGLDESDRSTGGRRRRYRVESDRADVVDVLDRPGSPRGQQGTGTVHHVAFRATNDETQSALSEAFAARGLRVTEQKDRQYFRSTYAREPGGVLFEVATDGPGFDRDEPVDSLGSSLKLPPWLEDERDRIEAALAELDVRGGCSAGGERA